MNSFKSGNVNPSYYKVIEHCFQKHGPDIMKRNEYQYRGFRGVYNRNNCKPIYKIVTQKVESL